MTKHKEGQYVICGGSDTHWQATAAKNLRGAKSIASRTYQKTIGGQMHVAVVRGEDYEVLAVKRGYGNWQSA